MKSMLNKVFTVSAMSAIALTVALSSGCKFTGGGTIESASGIEGEKATVALVGKCDDLGNGDIRMSLNVNYIDHGTGTEYLRFHGESEFEVSGEVCDPEGSDFPVGYFVGEYCPKPHGQYKNTTNAGCGVIELALLDGGEGRHRFDVDAIVFELHGGAFDGVYHEGVLKGNFQSH